MKAFFSLLAFTLVFGNFLWANPSCNNEYFICHFNSEITTSEISELNQQGFKIIEKDSVTKKIIVVTSTTSSSFTAELKQKMESLIKVDEYGNRINVNTNCTHSSPDFLKLLFNFI